MTVAERMRRDGWVQRGWCWRKVVSGIVCYLDGGFGTAYVARTEGGDDHVTAAYDAEVEYGLRDLAQRAKTAARRLARKGRA